MCPSWRSPSYQEIRGWKLDLDLGLETWETWGSSKTGAGILLDPQTRFTPLGIQRGALQGE